MISKSEISQLKSLRLKKHREIQKKFLIEGKNMVREALKFNSVNKIYFTHRFNQENKEFSDFINNKFEKILISENQMRSISPTKSPSGIAALCDSPKNKTKTADSCWLYLDSISDPGNLGTLLRSACWFGLTQVALSENSVDPYNPKAVRSGMGAHFSLSIHIDLDINFFDKNKFIIIGGDKNGERSINLKSINKNWVLVLGSEAHGISDIVKEKLDKRLSIKKLGHGDSLNVSTSGSILMYILTTSQ